MMVGLEMLGTHHWAGTEKRMKLSGSVEKRINRTDLKSRRGNDF
jgi:hypothetical protein